MPKSQAPPEGDQQIIDRLTPKDIVLDVGAGDGKWGRLLNHLTIDALEVWPANAEKLRKSNLYREVHQHDMRVFVAAGYDAVILGDVLEHIPYEDALKYIENLKLVCSKVFLTIPVSRCEQDGNKLGNPYETHLYQWQHHELLDLGFELLHIGANPKGLVLIGTYLLETPAYK